MHEAKVEPWRAQLAQQAALCSDGAVLNDIKRDVFSNEARTRCMPLWLRRSDTGRIIKRSGEKNDSHHPSAGA